MGGRALGCHSSLFVSCLVSCLVPALTTLLSTVARSQVFSVAEPSLTATPTLREAAPSYFILPLSVPLASIGQALEELIPVVTGVDEFEVFSDSVEVRYGLSRDPFTLTLEHDHLHVSTEVYYWLETRGEPFGTAQCGSKAEPTTVNIGLDVLLGWRDDWRWGSRIRIVPTNFSRRCKPPEAGINFTHLLNEVINEWAVLPLVDAVEASVAEVGDLAPQLEEVWRALQEPIPTPANAWLTYRVDEIIAGQVGGRNQSIETEIAFVAHPVLTTGEKPAGTSLAMPDTRIRLPEDRIRVPFEVEVAIDSVETAIDDWLSIRSLPTSDGAAHWIGTRVFGQGDELVIALEVDGARKGTAYLTGTIAYDDETLFLFISKLAWTPESIRALFGEDPSTEELDALDELRRGLSSCLHFDLRRPITTSLVQIGRGINQQLSPGVEIKGGAMVREPLGNYLTDRVLRIRIAATGKVALVIS